MKYDEYQLNWTQLGNIVNIDSIGKHELYDGNVNWRDIEYIAKNIPWKTSEKLWEGIYVKYWIRFMWKIESALYYLNRYTQRSMLMKL